VVVVDVAEDVSVADGAVVVVVAEDVSVADGAVVAVVVVVVADAVSMTTVGVPESVVAGAGVVEVDEEESTEGGV
jgi:hypothetical protein